MRNRNYTRTGRQINDIGSYAAIRQDEALFEIEQRNAAQGNLTNGWIISGLVGASTTLSENTQVNRILFSNDTLTAFTRGPINNPRIAPSAHGNTTSGWIFGGANGPTDENRVYVTVVDRINFINDTALAQPRGATLRGTELQEAIGNATDAWICGGRNITDSVNITIRAIVERVIFENDLINATTRQRLTNPREVMMGSSNSTDGWLAGGDDLPTGSSSTVTVSFVERIIFANDTEFSTVRGNLTSARQYGSQSGNSSDMWVANGENLSNVEVSTIERITFTNDTSVALVRNPSPLAVYGNASTGNTTDMWLTGGRNTANISTSSIVRITFASDTSIPQTRGPMPVARFVHSGL